MRKLKKLMNTINDSIEKAYNHSLFAPTVFPIEYKFHDGTVMRILNEEGDAEIKFVKPIEYITLDIGANVSVP